MDLTPFKKDIDELIADFAKVESTTLGDMKRVWLSKKFSNIYEASPSSNLAFFMQSLCSHAIGYMSSAASLSIRLGGLYCLYGLHETQPFKPHFRIYLSLEELKNLRNLVIAAKEIGLKGVSALVRKMLENNVFLLGFLDINEGAVAGTVDQLTELQNARVRVAYEQLFSNSKIQDFIHLDMGMEVDLNTLKKMSSEYAEAKKLAINEASGSVDVQNIEHIAKDDQHVGDVVEKITEDWDFQKEQLCQQTGLRQQHHEDHEQQLLLQNDDDNFEHEQQLLLQNDDDNFEHEQQLLLQNDDGNFEHEQQLLLQNDDDNFEHEQQLLLQNVDDNFEHEQQLLLQNDVDNFEHEHQLLLQNDDDNFEHELEQLLSETCFDP